MMTLATVTALATLGIAGGGPSATDVLQRSFARSFSVNVRALIAQRDPMGSTSGLQTVKVERDTAGRTHNSVTQPLRDAGIEIVDDGQKTTIYWADANLLVTQDSMAGRGFTPAQRVRLATRNYKISMGLEAKIAGRRAYVVVAEPKDQRLALRKYYVDMETFYPLRLESYEGGVKTLMYDTKDITFPARIDPDHFRLKPVGNPRVREYPPPAPTTARLVRDTLGFGLRLPRRMPLGFAVQSLVSNDSENWHRVSVRITDGLVQATVYQWQTSSSPDNSLASGRNYRESGNVSILLVTDQPRSVTEILLDAFASAPQARWQLGPSPLAGTSGSEPHSLLCLLDRT